MASIRRRGTKWQVQVRRQGFPPISKTFHTKADASEWARHWEAKADRGELPENRKVLSTTSLGDLVRRYLAEVVPRKRGAEIETITLNAFLREPICNRKLATLTSEDFLAYCDRRLQFISPKSLSRQLSPISHMFNVARNEWRLPLHSNPVSKLRLRDFDKKRNRRLNVDELQKLVSASRKTRNPLILPLILFALETAMRRGELLAMRWTDIDLEKRTVAIPEAKNGRPRVIPLTSDAAQILRSMHGGSDFVFPLKANALRLAWDRLTARAGVEDLNFHDLRHEAVSRLFEAGLTVPEVASVSGHRDIRMLMRYAHADAEKLARKLP